jgi:hypothetical protein
MLIPFAVQDYGKDAAGSVARARGVPAVASCEENHELRGPFCPALMAALPRMPSPASARRASAAICAEPLKSAQNAAFFPEFGSFITMFIADPSRSTIKALAPRPGPAAQPRRGCPSPRREAVRPCFAASPPATSVTQKDVPWRRLRAAREAVPLRKKIHYKMAKKRKRAVSKREHQRERAVPSFAALCSTARTGSSG